MQSIGRYQIQGELGRGAMGVVYRALDPVLNRTVAVKTIHLAQAGPERDRLRDRLLREARLAGALSHPGIVTIFDVIEEDGNAYICMECVSGPTLADFLQSGRAPSRETVLSILRQTAAALDYAHAQGIVHRDIKPANIMLHADSIAKITDFGVAKANTHSLTQTSGSMMGTPNYMPPEQVKGESVDGRADQYALAVLAFEILTGELPFTADRLPTLVFRIVNEPPASARLLNQSLPATVDAVLARALAKAREERFPTCTAFFTALEAALGQNRGWYAMAKGVSASLPTAAEVAPPPARPSPRRRSYGRLVFATVMGFAVLSGIVWTTRDRSSQRPELEPQLPPVSEQDAKPSPAGAAVETPPSAPEPKPDEPATPVTAEPRRPEPPKETPAAPQRVQFFSSPAAASVTIEGSREQCLTPCTLTLPPGRHLARIALNGHREAIKFVEVPRDTYITAPLVRQTGTLAVKSNPPGSLIRVNGQEQASKTPTILTLPVGHYKVEISKEGYGKDEQEIDIKDSVITNLEINWLVRNPQ